MKNLRIMHRFLGISILLLCLLNLPKQSEAKRQTPSYWCILTAKPKPSKARSYQKRQVPSKRQKGTWRNTHSQKKRYTNITERTQNLLDHKQSMWHMYTDPAREVFSFCIHAFSKKKPPQIPLKKVASFFMKEFKHHYNLSVRLEIDRHGFSRTRSGLYHHPKEIKRIRHYATSYGRYIDYIRFVSKDQRKLQSWVTKKNREFQKRHLPFRLFIHVKPNGNLKNGTSSSPKWLWQARLLSSKAFLLQNDIKTLQLQFNMDSKTPVLVFKLHPKGKYTWDRVRLAYKGRSIAFVLGKKIYTHTKIDTSQGNSQFTLPLNDPKKPKRQLIAEAMWLASNLLPQPIKQPFDFISSRYIKLTSPQARVCENALKQRQRQRTQPSIRFHPKAKVLFKSIPKAFWRQSKKKACQDAAIKVNGKCISKATFLWKTRRILGRRLPSIPRIPFSMTGFHRRYAMKRGRKQARYYRRLAQTLALNQLIHTVLLSQKLRESGLRSTFIFQDPKKALETSDVSPVRQIQTAELRELRRLTQQAKHMQKLISAMSQPKKSEQKAFLLSRFALRKLRYIAFEEKKFSLSVPVSNVEVAAFVKTQMAQVKAYYKKHLHKYQKPEKVRVRHILLKHRTINSKKHDKRIQQKLTKIRAELLKAPHLFAQYAQKYSEGPTSIRGGDLGFFRRGRMVPAFSKASFRLSKAGQISPLVRTIFGYHLIQLIHKRKKKIIPLAQVQDQIGRRLLIKSKRHEILKKQMERLYGAWKRAGNAKTLLQQIQKEAFRAKVYIRTKNQKKLANALLLRKLLEARYFPTKISGDLVLEVLPKGHSKTFKTGIAPKPRTKPHPFAGLSGSSPIHSTRVENKPHVTDWFHRNTTDSFRILSNAQKQSPFGVQILFAQPSLTDPPEKYLAQKSKQHSPQKWVIQSFQLSSQKPFFKKPVYIDGMWILFKLDQAKKTKASKHQEKKVLQKWLQERYLTTLFTSLQRWRKEAKIWHVPLPLKEQRARLLPLHQLPRSFRQKRRTSQK